MTDLVQSGMKKLVLLSVVALANVQMIFAQGEIKSITQMTIMSYNIRYDNPADGINSWDNRKTRVASLLDYYRPQIFGLQEALHTQIQFLEEEMPGYDWIGAGRDDGSEKGEYSPVFYDTSTIELKEWGTFWLSDDPERPSTGWDAALPRICTWAIFFHKPDNQEIYFFNTHFDHRGEKARLESSRLITSRIKELKPGSKVILTGDFNQNPESPGYNLLAPILNDSFTKGKQDPYGPAGTFSGFESGNALGERIDYIFTSQNLFCENFRTITDNDGQYYPSDHLPVFAIISW